MDAAGWDARYAMTDLVWSAQPNRWVVETFGERPPGRGLDLGAGEGRNTLWLAERGWGMTAVDFSGTAIDKGQALHAERDPSAASRTTWIHADLLHYDPSPRSFTAVLVMYIHLPADERRVLLRKSADALADGGVLLVVGHDRTNPAQGVGGPSDPAVLFTADDVVRDLAGLPGLSVSRAERVSRAVGDGDGGSVAFDALVEVVRIT